MRVLILVLMEYALRDERFSCLMVMYFVLILVLMEYALRAGQYRGHLQLERCLNPCFNGICSARYQQRLANAMASGVLILVLMEYALRVNELGYFCILPKS